MKGMQVRARFWEGADMGQTIRIHPGLRSSPWRDDHGSRCCCPESTIARHFVEHVVTSGTTYLYHCRWGWGLVEPQKRPRGTGSDGDR
jgi:hypothetical protein